MAFGTTHGSPQNEATPFSSIQPTHYAGQSYYWDQASFAAGLRCTLANSAYNARELASQYADSGALLGLTSEDGLATTQEALRNLGLTGDQVNERIVVLGSSLGWLGGPAAPGKAEAAGHVHMEGLLKPGSLTEEEKFDGSLAHETVYLCYSSGTTEKSKGTTHQNVTSQLDIITPVFPPTNRRLCASCPFITCRVSFVLCITRSCAASPLSSSSDSTLSNFVPT
ncbi:hypothetical protein AX14_003417 [Amanita brunnescens Koide BX004]|nr:hypothetical protein AX14_003417 [Amanita brunnescens Koide BX004]